MTDDDREPVKIRVVLSLTDREAKAIGRLAGRHQTDLDTAATVAVLLGLDVAEPPAKETRTARILGPRLPDFFTTCMADPDLAGRFEGAGITRELFGNRQRGEFVPERSDVWGPDAPEYAVVRSHAAKLKKLPPTRINPQNLELIEKDEEHFATVVQLLTAGQRERVGNEWLDRFRDSPETMARYGETVARVTGALTGYGSGDADAPPTGGPGARRRTG